VILQAAFAALWKSIDPNKSLAGEMTSIFSTFRFSANTGCRNNNQPQKCTKLLAESRFGGTKITKVLDTDLHWINTVFFFCHSRASGNPVFDAKFCGVPERADFTKGR
jgi:hypothetical protein